MLYIQIPVIKYVINEMHCRSGIILSLLSLQDKLSGHVRNFYQKWQDPLVTI